MFSLGLCISTLHPGSLLSDTPGSLLHPPGPASESSMSFARHLRRCGDLPGSASSHVTSCVHRRLCGPVAVRLMWVVLTSALSVAPARFRPSVGGVPKLGAGPGRVAVPSHRWHGVILSVQALQALCKVSPVPRRPSYTTGMVRMALGATCNIQCPEGGLLRLLSSGMRQQFDSRRRSSCLRFGPRALLKRGNDARTLHDGQ